MGEEADRFKMGIKGARHEPYWSESVGSCLELEFYSKSIRIWIWTLGGPFVSNFPFS